MLKNAQKKLAKDLQSLSKSNSAESLGLNEKSKSKAVKQQQSDDSSSINTDDGLKDDEVRLYTIDEKTGEKIEKKEKIGFDRLQ